MPKKILSRDIPEQVFTDTVGGIFPITKDMQENGTLIVGADMTIPRMLYNPATRTTEMQRTANTLKRSTLVATAGDTALWTPTTGKRFRWLGFSVVMDPATTTAAGSLVTIKDGATTIDDVLALPIAATNQPFRAWGALPGNGYLSAAVDNVMYVNLSNAATAGGVYINVWGTEE